MAGKLSIRGSRALVEQLALVSHRVGPEVGRAFAEASELVVRAARPAAPVDLGFLKTSLGYEVRRGRNRNYRYAVIGAKVQQIWLRVSRGGRTRRIDPRKYIHLAEQGTAPHSLSTGVDMRQIRRGRTPWDRAWRRTRHGWVPINPRNVEALRAVEPEDLLVRPREQVRQMARNFLYQRDARAGRRVHPGAKPHPFLQPALEQQRGEVEAIIAERLSAALTKAVMAS